MHANDMHTLTTGERERDALDSDPLGYEAGSTYSTSNRTFVLILWNDIAQLEEEMCGLKTVRMRPYKKVLA